MNDKNTTELHVVDYLKQHPDFFERHLDLLTLLHTTHPISGNAISLVERQLAVLREQNRVIEETNRKMEHQLDEMLEVARTNQRVSHHLNVLAKELVESNSLLESINTIETVIKKQFRIDYVQLHLFEDTFSLAHRNITHSDRVAYFTSFLCKGHSICGDVEAGILKRLFADNVSDMRSAALVPVRYIDDLAILALGSKDPERYQSDMGVYFLDQLGALTASALVKYLN